METSLETSRHTPINLNKGSMESSPRFSPSSDERFWSALRSRIDVILKERNSNTGASKPCHDQDRGAQLSVGDSGRGKRLKEDVVLLMRGFDSVAQTLSHLSSNLDTALQGANDLAKPPTLTEIFHSGLERPRSQEEDSSNQTRDSEVSSHNGVKRKYDSSHCLEEQRAELNETEQEPKDGRLKKAKNLAVSMAAKAASLARELRFIKSDLGFVQERCSVLEEENKRLRDGFAKGIRPEEDDLVRLQLEALLAEKSRLANENANLTRENQCLNQLVEYHQLTSQNFSVSEYEQVMQGMCLDFSSPPPPLPPPQRKPENETTVVDTECFQTPCNNLHGFSDSLND